MSVLEYVQVVQYCEKCILYSTAKKFCSIFQKFCSIYKCIILSAFLFYFCCALSEGLFVNHCRQCRSGLADSPPDPPPPLTPPLPPPPHYPPPITPLPHYPPSPLPFTVMILSNLCLVASAVDGFLQILFRSCVRVEVDVLGCPS